MTFKNDSRSLLTTIDEKLKFSGKSRHSSDSIRFLWDTSNANDNCIVIPVSPGVVIMIMSPSPANPKYLRSICASCNRAEDYNFMNPKHSLKI